MATLKEGINAPEFNLPASNGKNVALKDFKGKKRIILYFYPRDNTPGCTTEACGFRDSLKAIEKKDAVVLGVSPDGLSSHNKFIEKFNLPFILLSDEEKKTCRDYGVWVKKKMYGKEHMGIARTTFIIGKDGKIEKIYKKVKPAEHSEEILIFLSRTAGLKNK
ncbi:MAG: thioredoxin-dependent thiol peroxidase [Candidatus Scalinduaceae bacterium]